MSDAISNMYAEERLEKYAWELINEFENASNERKEEIQKISKREFGGRTIQQAKNYILA